MWGIARSIEKMPANEDMVVVKDPNRRDRIRHARRSDVFSLVALSVEQQRAAKRYERDWMIRGGAKVDDETFLQVMVDSSSDGQGPTQRMIDAGGRIADAHREIGRACAHLLEQLVEPMAMRGEIRAWRGVVQRCTAENERHAQAAAVRQACENLHQAYAYLDDEASRARKGGDRFAGGGAY